jgi:hypothetical protein
MHVLISLQSTRNHQKANHVTITATTAMDYRFKLLDALPHS